MIRVGIVGAGNIGGALVRKLRESGHGVRIANSRGPESLSDLAAETGATAVTTAEVGAGVDVLIVSVRFQQLTALTPLISEVASDITVVDTSNYLPVFGQPERPAGSPCRCQETLPKASGSSCGWSRTPVSTRWTRARLPSRGVSKWELRPGAPSSPPTSSARPSDSPTAQPLRSAATQQGTSSRPGRTPRTSRTGSGCTALPPAFPRPMPERRLRFPSCIAESTRIE